jgi:hypothetical protein
MENLAHFNRKHFGCAVSGCMKKHHAKGYCTQHYWSVSRWGDPEFTKIQLPITEDERLRRIRETKRRYKKSEKGLLAEQRYKSGEAYRKMVERGNATERARQRKRKYRLSEKGRIKLALGSIRRQERVRLATPQWADRKKINAIYNNCPKGHHVDHIIPLRGKNVCGLHVHTNLRYLKARANLKKSNKTGG